MWNFSIGFCGRVRPISLEPGRGWKYDCKSIYHLSDGIRSLEVESGLKNKFSTATMRSVSIIGWLQLVKELRERRAVEGFLCAVSTSLTEIAISSVKRGAQKPPEERRADVAAITSVSQRNKRGNRI